MADGAGILHRHHQVSSQEVDQDVGDVGAQRLQDVFGNVDLGFICTIKQFPFKSTLNSTLLSLYSRVCGVLVHVW